MSNYLAHDLTVDELNRVFRLIQGDIFHAKGSTSAAPTQTVLGSSSVASLTANPSTPSTGAGTVTTVSVVSVNGFSGTVTNATTTPAITLTTTLTQGSIVFIGSSGSLSQDNANFLYNPIGYGGNSNMEIGPRGTNPLDASYEFYVTSGVTAHFHNTNPTQSITGGVTIGLMYVPAGSAVTSGNRVGSFEFGGSIDVANDVAAGAAIRCYATQNYSGTTIGTKMVFQTVPNGSATLTTALTIGQDQSANFVGLIDISTIGKGIQVAEGSNAKQGVATLALGTVTIANTSVTATSRVFLSRQGLNASTTLGELAVNSRIAGTSFTITAYIPTTALVSTGDVSTIAYEIIEPG